MTNTHETHVAPALMPHTYVWACTACHKVGRPSDYPTAVARAEAHA